jgi:hypothetical protein
MSNLTDFFPQSSGSSSKNAAILLVGGGGGGSAGFVKNLNPACPVSFNTAETCGGYGGGGGGVYIGHLDITEGCTYPVIVGSGGACGCLKPDCAGEPGGAGSPGGLSRFGSFVVGGGGGAGTLCVKRYTPTYSGFCCFYCQPTKMVGNKVGANMGSFGKQKCAYQGCIAIPISPVQHGEGNERGHHQDLTEFHVYDECSAGGGFQGLFTGCASPTCDMYHRNYSVARGAKAVTPTGCWTGGWELVPSFYGLAVIPCDTCNPGCKERIVYCCGPTCQYPGRPDGGPSSTWTCNQCMPVCGKWIATNWELGNSRIGFKKGMDSLAAVIDGSLCCMESPWCMMPPVANTGAGGFNHMCPANRPCFPGFTPIGNGSFDASNPSYAFSATGDAGVVYIVYDCSLGAASSTPGAVDCTPVTGPQGYRSYRYTSSGSFTL